MKKYDYFINIGSIGISIDTIELEVTRKPNYLWFRVNDKVVFFINLNQHELKYKFIDDGTIYFDIKEVSQHDSI